MQPIDGGRTKEETDTIATPLNLPGKPVRFPENSSKSPGFGMEQD